MNPNSFEGKHSKLYIEIPDTEESIENRLKELSKRDQYLAIIGWRECLNQYTSFKPEGTKILERIWKEILFEKGISKWDGITYLYYQLFDIVAIETAIKKIKEEPDNSLDFI
jgi:hypothetical protein